MTWIIIVLCGGLGAVARYSLEQYLKSSRGWKPLNAVAAINLLGSGLLGLLSGIVIIASETQSQSFAVTAAVGAAALCGGFTTFSTAMVEAAKAPRLANSAGNLLYTLVGCMILYGVMALLGSFLGAWIFNAPFFPV